MVKKSKSKLKRVKKKGHFGRVLRYGAMCSALLFVSAMVITLVNRGIPGDVLLIKNIQIIGDLQKVQQASLEGAISGISKMGFFSTDVKLLKGIVEQIPWVNSVSVRRVWPDKLQLNIKEQVAIARWGENKLINSGGLLFDPGSNSIPKNILYLSGPKGKQKTLLEQYRELESVLNQSELKIAKLIISDRRTIQLELENGVRILFGRANNIGNDTSDAQAALYRFVIAYHGGLSKRIGDIDLIDMRYTNGFSVRWKDTVS